MGILVVPSVNRFPYNRLYAGGADDASAFSIIRGEDVIIG
jgi:hypothetical protein